MNEDDLNHLLRDVVESDPSYLQAREATWERLRANQHPRRRLRPTAWALFAAAASVAIAIGAIAFHAHRGNSSAPVSALAPSSPTALVEIVSTTDLPPACVEIDGPALRRLFPEGIVIAYGQNPQAFTFDHAGRSRPSD